jgi:PAS domain S-box-containing protein
MVDNENSNRYGKLRAYKLEESLEETKERLQEAEEALEAIRNGVVDGLVQRTPNGNQIFMLKGSEQPYRELIEEMNEGAVLLSENGTVLYCNSGFAQLLDSPLHKVMGRNIFDWVSKNNSDLSLEFLSTINDAGKRTFFFTFETMKKQLIPTQVSINKIRFGSVDIKALIITDLTKHMKDEVKRYTVNLEREITERKKAEKALVSSGKKYRRLFETSQDGIVSRDRNGKMMNCNSAYAKMVGFTKNELKQISPPELLPERWHEQRKHMFNQVLNSGKSVIFEREYRRKDGTIFPASVRSWRLIDEKGEILGVWSVVRDITHQKKLQRELEQYNLQLEKVIEERTRQLKDAERLAAIGATAGMVGHDIRNPLQAIVSDLYITKQELKEAPESERKKNMFESLEAIENNIFYINKIVSDLQDYAKPLKPCMQDIDIRLVIAEALVNSKVPNNIEVQNIVSYECEMISGDFDLLKRVVSNLVLNAIQAMPQGGTLTIRVRRNKEIGDIVLTIKDTGVGIPDGVKNKLFTPMFTTKSKGQGFGLCVVKRIIEALGGNISIESQVGKGTIFTLCLPQKS